MYEKPRLEDWGIIDRAGSAVTVFTEAENHDQKNDIAYGFVECSGNVAKLYGINDFMEPFIKNDKLTISILRDIAISGSEKFCRDPSLKGMLACCCYAAVAAICSLRLGEYKEDRESRLIAETVLRLFAAGKVADDLWG